MSQPTEKWKPVVNYEGYYEVSNHGRVRSCARVITDKNGHAKALRSRARKPVETPKGYATVQLHRPGVRDRQYVHRLVLEAFVGKCPPGHECAHYNGVRNDNRLANLRWATSVENERDKFRHGTRLGR